MQQEVLVLLLPLAVPAPLLLPLLTVTGVQDQPLGLAVKSPGLLCVPDNKKDAPLV